MKIRKTLQIGGEAEPRLLVDLGQDYVATQLYGELQFQSRVVFGLVLDDVEFLSEECAKG